MNKRVTIALGVVALILGAFIYFYEKDRLSTGEVEARRGQVLTRFVRARLDRIELVRGEADPVVLERRREDEDELGTWFMVAPLEAPADEDAVDGLLGALEWMAARRTLREISAEDRETFGLDSPRFRVRFRVAAEEGELLVGGEEARGRGIYVSVAGADVAYVVDADLIEALDHDTDHFRDKALFRGFRPRDAESLTLGIEGETIELSREDGVWTARAPFTGWVRSALLDPILRLPTELTATRFAAESADDLARYGLDEPWRSVSYVRPEEGAESRGARRGRLRVGAPCEDRAGERYAIANDEGPIVCVLESAISSLSPDLERLRDSRLVRASDDAVESIVIVRAGRRVEVRRHEGGWQLLTGSSGSPGDPVAADGDAISDWLAELRPFEAVAHAAPGEARGIEGGPLRLELRRGDVDRVERLRFGALEGESIWVQREGEPAALRFPASALEALSVEGWRFRDRALVAEDVASGTRIEAVRASEREVAERSGAAWRLTAPLEVEADRVTARELVRQVATLRALRFVAARPSAEHGLASPRLDLKVRFEGSSGEEATEGETSPREHRLRVGADTEGGAFAQLGELPEVFVVASEAVQALEARLASLDLISESADNLQALAFAGGPSLRREGNDFVAAGEGAVDGDRTRTVLDRLGTLRASGVAHYGAGTAPEVQLTLTPREGEAFTLSIGAVQGEGPEAIRHVWRSDVGVVYRVRAELLAPIVAYTD